jgi:YbbR domain-containing protein
MNAIIAAASKVAKSITWRPSRTQLVRFGISIALATLLWGWVTDIQDPYTTKTITDVPIESGALPETLQIVSNLPNASVEVSGARSRVGPVQRTDIRVEIDTSGITGPGTFRVPLIADVPNVSNQSVEPNEVSIQVDERVSKNFPLKWTTTNAADQTRSVGEIVPSVTEVTVAGPRTAVERVSEVILPVTIERQTQSYDATYMPYAVDSAGQRISEVEILPDAISTHVEVQTRGKAVSVIAVVTGDPAEGFSIQQRRAIPDTIVVDGPADVLDELLFINTEPVDVTDVTQSISTRVGLEDLPEGVTIIEPASGTVEVRVAIEDTTSSSQTLSDLEVEGIGLDDGLTATFEPGTVAIQVSAPLEILQAMKPEDISILVDLDGLTPGVYRLTPEVTVPQGATWIGGEPSNVLVTVEESNQPSPSSSTPAASPAP